jgi:hypothetical protein
VSSEITSWVDHHQLACQIGEWDIEEIVEFVKDIDRYRAETALSEPLRKYFVEVMKSEELAEDVKWPMTMNDPARAIHETIESGNCEAWNPLNCMAVSHRTIQATIDHYHTWLKHREVDVVGQLSRLGDS